MSISLDMLGLILCHHHYQRYSKALGTVGTYLLFIKVKFCMNLLSYLFLFNDQETGSLALYLLQELIINSAQILRAEEPGSDFKSVKEL